MNLFCISSFKKFFFLIIIFSQIACGQPKKVGLLIMATGKYTCFLEKLCRSADRFFLPGHERTYFIFTDGQVPQSDAVVRIEQKRLGWPYDTMMRFKVYHSAAAHFADFDYLFACDADMLFIDTVGDEILGDRVATRHPGFSLPKHRHDDYERREISRACVAPGQGQYYFAGGFYGGTKDEFLKMALHCSTNIALDLEQGVIALWHDESHLNRYFIDNPPTVVLCPSYCYPQFWILPFTPRLIALNKNHKEYQTAL